MDSQHRSSPFPVLVIEGTGRDGQKLLHKNFTRIDRMFLITVSNFIASFFVKICRAYIL
jgi:hypothetical protein